MSTPTSHTRRAAQAIVALAALAAGCSSRQPVSGKPPAAQKIPVEFSGGHETDPRDNGRPVSLIAAALGVPPEVFREAFSHVPPAPAGTEPDPEQVRRNKDALLSALGKFGVTNDQLDKVSDHYRYVRSRGDLWPTKPAEAHAVIESGAVTRFEITDPGFGYTSPPTVSVPGFKDLKAEVKLSLGKDFDSNGSIESILLVPDGKDEASLQK
jgi:hypothetical protein